MTVVIDRPIIDDAQTDLVPLAHICKPHSWSGECLPDRSNCSAYCGATKSHYAPDAPMPPERDVCQVCHEMWLAERARLW